MLDLNQPGSTVLDDEETWEPENGAGPQGERPDLVARLRSEEPQASESGL